MKVILFRLAAFAALATLVQSNPSWTTHTIVVSEDSCDCHCGCIPGSAGPRCDCLCECDYGVDSDPGSNSGSGDGHDENDSSSNSSDEGSDDSGSGGSDSGADDSDDGSGGSAGSECRAEGGGGQGQHGASGALIPGLLKTNFQPMFEVFAPNPLDPSYTYQFDEKKKITVEMCEITSHETGIVDDSNEPLTTAMYGYRQHNSGVCSSPGYTFEISTNTTYYVRWFNNIPIGTYLLTGLDGTPVVDTSLHWAFSMPGYESYSIESDGVPAVVHFHGGHTDYQYDGNPDFFFTPNFEVKGPGWVSEVYEYEEDSSGSKFYHDHTLGITRLNVYSGLYGWFIVRDEFDTGKPNNPLGLPAFPYEAAYVIQDRMFKEDGSLFYPAFPGDPKYDDYITLQGAQLPADQFPNGGPSVFAEFFGDVMTVNGKIWPKSDVEARNYRLRLLNSCDSRFLVVQFVQVCVGAKEVPVDATPLPFTVIGTDDGFAYEPQTLDTLVIEPAGRYDLIFDFTDYEGYRIIMKNLGPDSPYNGAFDPAGQPRNGTTFLRTDRIMAFDVVSSLDVEVPEIFDASLISNSRSLPESTRTRKVGLFEGTDSYGRILPLLGTVGNATDYQGNPIYWPDTESYQAAGLANQQMEGTAAWHSPTTENPACGSVEEWEIWNFSVDAHPIHLHLVHFEILSRNVIVWDSNTTDANRVIDPAYATGDGTFLVDQPIVMHDGSIGVGARAVNAIMGDTAIAPEAYFENGPKDMVMSVPGEVVRIKAHFDKPGRYVWHCHILSHEDAEMMRVLHVGEGANDQMVMSGGGMSGQSSEGMQF